MTQLFKCDICNKETTLYPEGEPLMETKEVSVEVPNLSEQPVEVPITEQAFKQFKRQNPVTKKKEWVKKPLFKYSTPKTVLIQIKVDGETVTRDFCEECYDKYIKDEAEGFYNFLLDI